MKRLLYPVLRKLLLIQQRWADRLRVLPDRSSAAEGTSLPSRMALQFGAWAFRLGRSLIGPELRARIRMWLTGLAIASQGELPVRRFPVSAIVRADRQGINVIGPVHAELGLGESARSSLRAAAAAGIKASATEYRAGCSARNEEHVDSQMLQGQKYAVNLFHMNADQLYVAYNVLGSDSFSGYYNILYCVWEQDELPGEWVPAFDLVHEVWTASSFCQDTISRKISKPVVRIPHNVELSVPNDVDRRSLGLPEEGFLFLGMADFMSSPERKNPLGSLEAYTRSACCEKNDVYFVLKTINTHIRPDTERKLKQFRDDHPSIILMDGYLSRPEVNALFNCCDCFVSLHRAEGFGLPLAEAMYLGKPVIATGWSGNTDFMNVGNSLPVEYTIVPLDRDSGPYRKGFHWAEPNVDHASELMDLVTGDDSLVRRIGMQARHDIITHFSPEPVGRLMSQRLNRIYDWLRRSDDRESDSSCLP